ncbi:unnamed protein product [Pleuronectes platessa]|uniref:Uncharacterized protein n=1 Tax=Pleuronectes platessa TaxID=8262 RepID=A0A9N7Z972_PLEPL|nr:unnamed protein product [Pleuronectes platessa]
MSHLPAFHLITPSAGGAREPEPSQRAPLNMEEQTDIMSPHYFRRDLVLPWRLPIVKTSTGTTDKEESKHRLTMPLSKAPYSPNICSLGAVHAARELSPLMRLLGDTLVACDVARDVDGRSSGNCSGIGGDGTKLESVLEAGATLIERQQQRWRWREGADFLHGSTDKEERDKKT